MEETEGSSCPPKPTAPTTPAGGLCSLGLAFTPPFNFHHTRSPNVFEKETVMVGGWALTDRDVAMMRSLYAAGLGPGATRAELAAAGIVNP
jgi:hypothetical protein